MKWLALGLASALAISACASTRTAETLEPPIGPTWTVSFVHDPETGECMHLEAKRHLERAALGAEVRLRSYGDDQFGRLLAQVWLASSETDVSRELVRLGLAIATTPDESTKLEEAEGGVLLDAESQASEAGLGLWAWDSCASSPLPEIVIDRQRSITDPYGPDDQDLASELIVVLNEGAKKVNLSDWRLRDESSRHRYVFAEGTQLGPGESLAVTSADPGWVPGGSPVWSNGGDIVMLLDRQGRVVDHWRYGQDE